VIFGGKDEIKRLSPPERVNEESALQLDDELLILIGGLQMVTTQLPGQFNSLIYISRNGCPNGV